MLLIFEINTIAGRRKLHRGEDGFRLNNGINICYLSQDIMARDAMGE